MSSACTEHLARAPPELDVGEPQGADLESTPFFSPAPPSPAPGSKHGGPWVRPAGCLLQEVNCYCCLWLLSRYNSLIKQLQQEP